MELHRKRAAMVEHGVYYALAAYGELVRGLGGAFADSKHRPIVCLVESKEQPGLYWAIPMGKWNHRTQEQQSRIYRYLDLPQNDIRSCYYHVGRTTSKSIFFVSDAFPITEKYIESGHLDAHGEHYIIKNPKLLEQLQRKLFRILSIENTRPDSFRQHITTVKTYLIAELNAREPEQEPALV